MSKNNFLIRRGLVSWLIFSQIKSFGQSRVGSVSFITDFLWHSLAHSNWNLLVFSSALLSWHLGTLLKGLVSTHLVWNLDTNLSWHILAQLLWHIIAHWVCNLSLLGLGHILTLIVGVALACSGDWCPDLVVSVALPLVFAVLLVLGGAFGLCVRLILSSVLVNTHVLVNGLALLLIHCVALLSGCGLTLSLESSFAHIVVLGHTLLGFRFLVGRVPDGGILCSALNTTGDLLGRCSNRLDASISLRITCGQSHNHKS